jgi:hypothetical protein
MFVLSSLLRHVVIVRSEACRMAWRPLQALDIGLEPPARLLRVGTPMWYLQWPSEP